MKGVISMEIVSDIKLVSSAYVADMDNSNHVIRLTIDVSKETLKNLETAYGKDVAHQLIGEDLVNLFNGVK